jgi:serine/threonine protein kinase
VSIISGRVSTPLSLIQADPPKSAACTWKRLALLHRICGPWARFPIFRGALDDGQKVVVKMAEYDAVPELCHEDRMYRVLSTLQGQVIPVCYGLFFIRPTCAILLTQDCGESLESFSILSALQRHETVHLFIFNLKGTHFITELRFRNQLKSHLWAIHCLGVMHNDIEPRNVVMSNSNLRVIDLGVAEDGHCCGDGTKCSDWLNMVEYIDADV